MTPEQRAATLPIWTGPVEPEPLGGGMTNRNFVVRDGGRRYVARIGDDIPVHHVMRFNELTASRAAHAAGISPAVVHAEPGVLVLEYIEAETLSEERVREPAMLERLLPLVRRCHKDVAAQLHGPALMFWVFHNVRDYARTLRNGPSAHHDKLPGLMETADLLEAEVGPVEIVFGHNDLLAANFLDEGERVWLIDWDYGGFNSPLFDLGGLASNNGLSEDQERWMLGAYYDRPADEALWRRYRAMKCASLLREAMWSMISEIHSEIDIDYAAYTVENLTRFQAAMDDFRALA